MPDPVTSWQIIAENPEAVAALPSVPSSSPAI
jgi:hypothetical protein